MIFDEAVSRGIAVSMEGATSDNVSFVLIRSIKDPTLFGVGYAIRHPNDDPDRTIGATLASARALIELGYNMELKALRRAGVDV